MVHTYKYYPKREAERYVKERDHVFDLQLRVLADKLLEPADRFSRGEIRAIALSGPSCSGKTTTANKLTQIFAEKGRKVHTISIDDYYLNREYLLSRSKDGEIDFDSPDTIDIDCLRKTISDIFIDNDKVIDIPVYNFDTGRREGTRDINQKPGDLFIFEGIQAIYPEVVSLLSPYPSTSVFINVGKAIDANGIIFAPHEIRLLRRLVRDYHRRGSDPHYTIKLWKGVRANEDVHIFPFAGRAMYQLDSTMGYDLGMLKPYLLELLPVFKPGDVFYEEAQNYLSILEPFTVLGKELLAPDSLFHEFI